MQSLSLIWTAARAIPVLGICCLFVTISCGRVGFDVEFSPRRSVEAFSTTCAPLPSPEGPTLQFGPAQARDLAQQISSAAPGTTIVLENGTYTIPAETPLLFDVPGMTLRSLSGDPGGVIINSPKKTRIAASGVTIAAVTFEANGISVAPILNQDTLGTLIYRVTIVDATIGVDIEPKDETFTISDNLFADSGAVACSHIILTETGRAALGRSPRGVRGTGIQGWHIYSNTIEGYWADGRNGRGIFVDAGSRDTIIDRNYVRNSFIGIQLGDQLGRKRSYPDIPCGTEDIQHYGGIIRNNVVFSTDGIQPLRGYSHRRLVNLRCRCGSQYRFCDSKTRPQLLYPNSICRNVCDSNQQSHQPSNYKQRRWSGSTKWQPHRCSGIAVRK